MSYYTSIIIITLLALGVLSVLISENDRIPNQKKRLFIATNILIALAAVAECTGVLVGGNTGIPKGFLSAIKAMDYTLTPMTGGVLIALMEKPHARNRLVRGLLLGNAVFQAVSAFRGWMVVIDERNYYTHGPLYPAYMALYSLILIILAIKMISYGKTFRKQNRTSLYATMLLIFTGIFMQELLGSDHRVAYIAAAFGEAFLFIHYSEFSQLQLDDKITEQQVRISIDPLTGVLSRFAYVDAIKACDACIPENLALFLIDINGLKAANDTSGHEAGDELICAAARCIERSLGRDGKTYRIGGDEFVVITAMTREQAEAALVHLNQLTRAWTGDRVSGLSLSVGVALAKELKGCSMEQLVREADRGMYEQKEEYYRISGNDRRRH